MDFHGACVWATYPVAHGRQGSGVTERARGRRRPLERRPGSRRDAWRLPSSWRNTGASRLAPSVDPGPGMGYGWRNGWAWEDGGRTWARLGIRRVRPFVAGGGFWRRAGLASRNPEWRRSNAAGYVRQSLVAEAAHLASLLFLAVIAGLFLVRGDWVPALVVCTANLLLNLLPIGVLRYNRLRLLAREVRPQRR